VELKRKPPSLELAFLNCHPTQREPVFIKKKKVNDVQSHSNTLACQFITLRLTHTDQTSTNTQIDTHTCTLFKPSPGISCHTTCLGELSRDRRCQLRVPQMPTSSQAEEKSSLSPSIICANPSWEIVKSMAYLPNSISHRQVLISYLDPFPSRTDDKSTSTKCDYLLIFYISA